jgi:hypothetical protein
MPRPRSVEVEPLAEDPERDVVGLLNEVINLKSSTDQTGTARRSLARAVDLPDFILLVPGIKGDLSLVPGHATLLPYRMAFRGIAWFFQACRIEEGEAHFWITQAN